MSPVIYHQTISKCVNPNIAKCNTSQLLLDVEDYLALSSKTGENASKNRIEDFRNTHMNLIINELLCSENV